MEDGFTVGRRGYGMLVAAKGDVRCMWGVSCRQRELKPASNESLKTNRREIDEERETKILPTIHVRVPPGRGG